MSRFNPLEDPDYFAPGAGDDLIAVAARMGIERQKREAAFASVYQTPEMIHWFVRALQREANLSNERHMIRYTQIATLLMQLDELATRLEQDTLAVVTAWRDSPAGDAEGHS